jgi:Ca2+:H+ antiporter
MDLTWVAVGSCTNLCYYFRTIALVGWAMGKNMTLNFPHFEIVLFVLSIMTVLLSQPMTHLNWLVGSC